MQLPWKKKSKFEKLTFLILLRMGSVFSDLVTQVTAPMLVITFWLFAVFQSKFDTKLDLVSSQGRIQKGFATGQPVWDLKFLSQINKKLKILTSLILIWMNSPRT